MGNNIIKSPQGLKLTTSERKERLHIPSFQCTKCSLFSSPATPTPSTLTCSQGIGVLGERWCCGCVIRMYIITSGAQPHQRVDSRSADRTKNFNYFMLSTPKEKRKRHKTRVLYCWRLSGMGAIRATSIGYAYAMW